MELYIVDTYVIETLENMNEHEELVKQKIDELNPEYYTVDTDVIRTVFRTTITTMAQS